MIYFNKVSPQTQGFILICPKARRSMKCNHHASYLTRWLIAYCPLATGLTCPQHHTWRRKNQPLHKSKPTFSFRQNSLFSFNRITSLNSPYPKIACSYRCYVGCHYWDSQLYLLCSKDEFELLWWRINYISCWQRRWRSFSLDSNANVERKHASPNVPRI